jgi:threonyl-tRNA synthetase
VVGDREEDAGEVSVRHHGEGDLGSMPVASLAERLRGEAGGD